ncbi:LysR family transcriptional regulator [Devosia sp. A8/3-2]|nr:LysR family transcriptional regulator [Devosia sp. A8/3-2]
MIVDLNLLPVFLAVAQEPNFRAAADRLGVTRSAVNRGIKRLEDMVGLSLVSRTTRSVRLTEAGTKLYDLLSQPRTDITIGLEQLASEREPQGLLRLAVTSIAEPFLSGTLIGSFAAVYPQVTIDVTVTDEEFDIVAAGFDAGVRLGQVIEQDMIAVRIGGDQREAVVASPGYIAEHGAPAHPRELIRHRCIGWRPAPNRAPYRWEFEESGTPFSVSVEPQITTNDLRFMISSALNGAGITFAMQQTFEPYITSGQLIGLLDDYLPEFPGFFLYFPQRRNMAPKLQAPVDHIRDHRGRNS